MTQFKQLELIYNQFLNLIDEINTMIDEEDYTAAVAKLEHKTKLIKKIQLVKKTVNFNDEEMQKARLTEQKIRDKELNTLAFLEKHKNEVGEELKNIKKKVKVSTAYAIHSEENQGAIIDIVE